MDDFESLYKEYYPRVFAYLIRTTRDRQVAEELTQETFFRVFKKIDDYKGACSFYTWVCRIAGNAYIDHLRREKKHRPLTDEELSSLRSPGPEDTVLSRDTAERIRAAIDALPEPYRSVCRMRLYDEMSFAQISAAHGKTQSWARVTYHRARLMILEEIE
ncbi:MAG: sigma-70 family RNA polymerase sigma factor [Clostridia bacterium]|nr:sigma-70 family RNA polymerase sigma factor [Clostridia bacterium]MBR6429567.1 sigma-70 family RNA polymerase sigma factor [Clostridia bacterium]